MSDTTLHTENLAVAQAFVAWEIVQGTTLAYSMAGENPDEVLKKVTNAYIKVYKHW